MNAQRIAKQLKNYFAHVAHPIQFAHLFGSLARGQALPFSDVDVAVYLDTSANPSAWRLLGGLIGDLQHEIKCEDIDLVARNEAPPRLAFRVLEQGLLLHSRDELLRGQVETAILRRYYDEAEVEQEYFHYQDKRILAGKMMERTPEMIDFTAVRERLFYIKNARAE